MADLMQKTKKELILMLQDTELAIQSLQNEQHVVLRSDYESVLDQLEQLKIVNKALGGQNEELAVEKNQVFLEQQRLQGELGNALSENHQIQNKFNQIQQEYEKLTCQYDSRKMEHEALEQRTKRRTGRGERSGHPGAAAAARRIGNGAF